MGNHDHGPALGQFGKGRLDLGLVVRVREGCGLVQNQDGSVFQEGPGNGDALLFAAGEVDTLGADDGVESIREFFHNVHALGGLQGCQDFFFGGIRLAQLHVVQQSTL